MKAQDFIKNKINKLIELFPKMKFIYKYDKESEIHEIIAIPESEYNKESFEEKEIELYNEFVEKFPAEGIVINTPEEAIIDDVFWVYEKEGGNYFDLSFSFKDDSLKSIISFLYLLNEDQVKNAKSSDINKYFQEAIDNSLTKQEGIQSNEIQDVTENNYSPIAA